MATTTTKAKPRSRGSDLAGRLREGIQEATSAPLPGARQLPVLHEITPKGECASNLENALAQVTTILDKSNRVFTFGDAIVIEVDRHDGTGPRLVPLRTGGRVEVGAEDWLANLFVCEFKGTQFPPPKPLIDVLLRAEPTMRALPRIKVYARRPVFDADFGLRGPGWHPEPGILVHGAAIEPVLFESDSEAPALDRLPSHLRTLLGGFCFDSPADLVNAVAFLLTGLLFNHFLTESKPLGLLDGNQPGVGKTLLGRTVGMVLGGTDPRLIHFTVDEEELQKRICAIIRGSQQSLLIFDNAKVKGHGVVESATIEANSMAPEISLRILGRSENYSRPNDLLWAITMNCTRASPDLVSRALPIRLAFEGDPKDRAFAGPEPIAHARTHRLEILAELTGMVVRWTQMGRPEGIRGHRCSHWAHIVGGILEVAGLPEFLDNYGEAAAAFNSALDELAALAEAAVAAGRAFAVFDSREGD